jgi:tetratricopeptide (TPR) repeat protein
MVPSFLWTSLPDGSKEYFNKRWYDYTGLLQTGGSLAALYEEQGRLEEALHTIDDAIDANKQIPDELYFLPRNLAIKARILARLGRTRESNTLYQKSADLIDSLLAHAPTASVERELLTSMEQVYAGYFDSLCSPLRRSRLRRQCLCGRMAPNGSSWSFRAFGPYPDDRSGDRARIITASHRKQRAWPGD